LGAAPAAGGDVADYAWQTLSMFLVFRQGDYEMVSGTGNIFKNRRKEEELKRKK